MRIGGDENISIDGLNKRISISTGGGTVSFGLDATGNTGIVINDGTTDLLVIDADGMHFHDATDERMRVGVQPDDSLNVVITKPGEDIEDVF